MSRLSLLLLLILAAGLVVGAYLLRPAEQPARASLRLADALGGDLEGYTRALEPRPFVFPDDHGPHDDFKLEWWYYTGNLATASGRRFGYQFTVFRSALAPPGAVDTSRASDWAADQVYSAHLALTDVSTGRFYAFERVSRGAAGLAGAQGDPLRVWVEDWSVTAVPEPDTSNGRTPPMRIRAAADGIALDVTLRSEKPLVLQGDDGLSRKSDEPGNASYYYSMTRLATTGALTVDGATYTVDGRSWMDREWSTSLLDEDQVGWDWFALQLDDGRDVMFGRLRPRTPGRSPYRFGTLVDTDGHPRTLDRTDVTVEERDTWTSPTSGAVYPVRWRMQIPSADLDLTITAQVDDQELDVAVRYWEGTVLVEGTSGGEAVTGSGYLEMTGYGDDDGESGRQGPLR